MTAFEQGQRIRFCQTLPVPAHEYLTVEPGDRGWYVEPGDTPGSHVLQVKRAARLWPVPAIDGQFDPLPTG